MDRVAALKIPVTFACKFPPLSWRYLYLTRLSLDGDPDHAVLRGGAEAIENLKAAGNPQSKLYIIEHAGHYRRPSSLPLPHTQFELIRMRNSVFW